MKKTYESLSGVNSVSLETVSQQAVDVDTQQFEHSTDIVRATKLVQRQRQYAFVTVLVPTLAMAFAVAQVISIGVSITDVIVCLVMYFLTLMGITVGFHRYLAHRSFKTSTTGRFALAVLGSMSAQGPALHWVSNHRRHHKHSDQPGDPHSPNLYGEGFIPRVKGFGHAHIGSMFSDEVTNFMLYSPDLVRDRTVMFVNRTYLWWVTLGIAVPAILCGLISQSWIGLLTGFLWGGMVRMFLVHHAIWSITSLAHLFGDRLYGSKDESRNSFLLALLTGGEGWHNNHHAFPSSPLFTDQLWRIDIGGLVIRVLHACKLVWDIHPVTPEMKSAKAFQPSAVSQAEN